MSKLLLLLVAVTLAIAGSAGATHTNGARPFLRLTGSQPVKLTGLRFQSRERVRVAVVAGKARRSRVVRATRAGRFVATFSDLSADRCRGLFASADGGRGSRATFKLVLVGCPPPL